MTTAPSRGDLAPKAATGTLDGPAPAGDPSLLGTDAEGMGIHLRPRSSGGDVTAATADGSELTAVAIQTLATSEVVFFLIAAGLLLGAVAVAQPSLWTAAAATISLATGLAGLLLLPPSPAAVLLLVLAGTNLAMEVLSLPGLLLHAIGGATTLALAGLCLHHPWSGAHPTVVIPAAGLVGAGTWWTARQSWRATRADPLASSSRLVGRDLVILDADDGVIGHAVVAGHLWAIHDPAAPLREGGEARVTGHSGELLTVRQKRTSRPTSEN
jgi:membrane-bound ClpP family serine protease